MRKLKTIQSKLGNEQKTNIWLIYKVLFYIMHPIIFDKHPIYLYRPFWKSLIIFPSLPLNKILLKIKYFHL